MAEPADYQLIGRRSDQAKEKGLVQANWYRSPVDHAKLKALMVRKNGPALRDTALWMGLLIGTGTLAYLSWGTLWAIPSFFLYGTLYGSSADSRWHECGHNTAFKTRWMNQALYQLACFMLFREPTVWKCSHARHHVDTIIVGRDREIIAHRPPDLFGLFLNIFAIRHCLSTFKSLGLHAVGRLSAEEKSFIPEREHTRVTFVARVWLLIIGGISFVAIATQSILPLMLVGLPTLYGAWLMLTFGLTQHAGLAEDVLDYRLNTRTMKLNPVLRFLYWNMNYHTEHHMFTSVPYHALPELHELIKNDCPPSYSGLIDAYREILPTLWRQRKNASFCVERRLP